MNGNDILNIMKEFPKIPYLGTFPSDLHCLPVINNYPSFFISNNDPHYKTGSHWTCFYAISSKNLNF